MVNDRSQELIQGRLTIEEHQTGISDPKSTVLVVGKSHCRLHKLEVARLQSSLLININQELRWDPWELR